MVIFSAWARDGYERDVLAWGQDEEDDFPGFYRRLTSAVQGPCSQNREESLVSVVP